MKKRIFIFLIALVMLLTAVMIPVAADSVQAPEILGASVRTEGVQGLRFVGRISRSCGVALTAGGASVNFGILLIPESKLAANTNITVNTANVKKVPAVVLMGQAAVEAVGLTYNSDYYYFSAVQTEIPAEFYGTNLLARAYVQNGSTYYYSTQVKRSVQFVAQKVVDEGGSIPAAITKALADFEEVGSDILVNAGAMFNWSSAADTSVLQNTYHRLTATGKLNVAYLGGSVTQGTGLSWADRDSKSWRGLTTAWLRSTFPGATITETNAAIGGTGSVFGTYRAMDDLKLTNPERKPDLLFVDFAINDMYDSPDSYSAYAPDVRSYMETIVRTVYTYAPYCDIIFVYVTDSTRLNKTSASDYATLAAQHDVATKYGLTEIYVGKQLCEEYSITSSTKWSNSGMFYDIVHPVESGYAAYAKYIRSVLTAELVNKNLNPYAHSSHSILSASYSPISYPARYFFNGAEGKTTGFTLHESSSLDEKGYLKATTTGETGAKVKFTFTGTGLQLWTYARTESSTIKVTIDGVSANYTIYRGGADNNKAYRVASGLSNTAHTVTIELTATSSTSGKELTLMALLVEGDPNYTGVTFQSVG